MKKQIFIYSSLFILGLLSSCSSTKKIKRIDLNAYRTQIIQQFEAFKLSLTSNESVADFHTHTKVYLVDATLEQSWRYYTTVPSVDYWKGPLTTYQKAYSKIDGELFLKEQNQCPSICEGIIYELDLQIAKYLHIDVQFEVTKIDAQENVIETTYGEENRSNGKQRIEFIGNGDQTLIVHTSFFKSDNIIRDKRLYPFFHEKCTDEFHLNAKKSIESSK